MLFLCFDNVDIGTKIQLCPLVFIVTGSTEQRQQHNSAFQGRAGGRKVLYTIRHGVVVIHRAQHRPIGVEIHGNHMLYKRSKLPYTQRLLQRAHPIGPSGCQPGNTQLLIARCRIHLLMEHTHNGSLAVTDLPAIF